MNNKKSKVLRFKAFNDLYTWVNANKDDIYIISLDFNKKYTSYRDVSVYGKGMKLLATLKHVNISNGTNIHSICRIQINFEKYLRKSDVAYSILNHEFHVQGKNMVSFLVNKDGSTETEEDVILRKFPDIVNRKDIREKLLKAYKLLKKDRDDLCDSVSELEEDISYIDDLMTTIKTQLPAEERLLLALNEDAEDG